MAKRKELASAQKSKGNVKYAKKGPTKVEEESNEESGNEGDSASEESEAEDEPSEDEGSEPEEHNDGLADMMSKILNQNIGSKVNFIRSSEFKHHTLLMLSRLVNRSQCSQREKRR